MVTKKRDDNAGSKRAAEFHDAMLGLPAYGDDSMFFMVRYVVTAKQRLRECDFDEFMASFIQINELWSEDKKPSPEQPETSEGPSDLESRYAKTKELKTQALEKVKDYPDLVRDFDRFTSNGRAVLRTFEALRKKQ
ncbi:hypothetical protein BGZ63DRAFT_256078 [Mariannaea sp. PMI_226]|nr:hypothetical protein BGZ63DRAFT_256078 [Mariannaea sp. PMI_226]